jgi:glycerol-3-phosphate dehydrogenase (NAD(P)+)
MEKITIIGDGGWGTTLAILLVKKGYFINLWGPNPGYVNFLDRKRENVKFLPSIRIPQEIKISSDIEEVAVEANLIILAVPSHFMREVVIKLKKIKIKDAIILSVSKGIENNTLMRMSELIIDVLGKQRIAVLSGPSIAQEVAREIPTTVVASSSDEKIAYEIQKVFTTPRFRVYTNSDIIGVELGGALKNIIAIAAGISDGLGFGTNAKAALLSRGLVEITKLGVAMGARQETFSGLSGIGDLVTTCISPYGRNRKVGEEIGKGKKLSQILKEMEMVAEGVRTSKSAYELSRKFGIEMPITKEVYCVLYEDKSPLQAVSELMGRKRKQEFGA